MFCSNCGKQVPPEGKFCQNCGQAVVAANAAGAQPASPPPPPPPQPQAPQPAAAYPAQELPKKKLKTWHKVAIGVAGFIFAVILLAMWGTSGLDAPVNKHFAALRAGDTVVAYSELSVAARQATSFDAFQAMVTNMPALTKVSGTSFDNRVVENGQGKLEGTLEIEGGGKLPIEIQLVKEKDEWKILAYHVKPAAAPQ